MWPEAKFLFDGYQVKLQHLSLRPTLKMGRGDLNIRQILILDLQLQVWSLKRKHRRFPFAGMPMSGFSTGTVNLAAFEASVDFQPHWSALFHGRGKQRNIALLGSSANEGNLFIWAPMKEICPQGSVCLAPSASTFPLLHVEASNKSIQPRFNL